ncbi:hypothetical protein V8E36_000375 [Tilletia maclaganii]
MEKQRLQEHYHHLEQQQQQQQDGAAPAYSEYQHSTASTSASHAPSTSTTLRSHHSIRKPVPSLNTGEYEQQQPSSPYRTQPGKALPIPYQPSPTSPSANSFIPEEHQTTMASYPPSAQYPNPHETRKGEHDYTDAYNNAVVAHSNGNGHAAAQYDDGAGFGTAAAPEAREPSPVPATGPTKGVGVPSSYNAFISFPLLSPWYPSTASRPNDYYDANVSGPRVYPPPLEARGLTESRFMQIQHFACSIRADSQRNKGLLCCGLGILLGGLGCVLIDHKCVGNKPLRDKVNRWAFENVNPRLEHDGIDVRFAYQKNALRAYFKDT